MFIYGLIVVTVCTCTYNTRHTYTCTLSLSCRYLRHHIMTLSINLCLLTLLLALPHALTFLVIKDFTINSKDKAQQVVITAQSLVEQKKPIMNLPNIFLPSSKKHNNNEHPPAAKSKEDDTGGEIIISDVIGRERSINIFAGFTRDIENISNRLETNEKNTTVLAPLNSEIQKLPRKPWEDLKDYETLGEQAYDGSGGQERAHKNLQKFVEAHIVPQSPWKEGQKVSSLGGGQVWWEERDGKKFVRGFLRLSKLDLLASC